MGTHFVTLDELFPPDPAAADNSGAEAPPTGAQSPQTPQGAPAGPDFSTRLTELERLVGRHREQLTGSQQEIQRLREENARLLAQHQAPPPAPPSPPPPATPRVSLVDATKKFLLDNDEAALREVEAALNQPTRTEPPAGVNPADVQRMLDERDATNKAVQQREAARNAVANRLVTNHPDLVNMTDPSLMVDVLNRYQRLKQDPLAQTLYPEPENFLYREDTTGTTYDMRILLQAANEAKASRPKPSTPSLGLTTGSGGPPPAAKGPVIPQHFLQGDDAVFQDPAIRAALAGIGWGATPKEQITKMLQHVDAATKAKWSRGEL